MTARPSITDWQPAPGGGWTATAWLPAGNLHLPAYDGRVIADGDRPQDPISVGTPLPWRAPFCVVQAGEAAHLVALRGGPDAFAQLRTTRSDEGWDLALTWREAAWLGETSPPPAVHLAAHPTWREAVRNQRDWMQRALPNQALAAPDWLADCPGCVMIEMWTGTGHIVNDYGDGLALVKALAQAGARPNTLLYFWGFHAPFDTTYPEYWPAEELGGADGFRRLVDTAHEHGFRLLPHCNWWGLDGRLPAYATTYADHQVRNRSGERAGWREAGEPPIEYIRPTYEPWRRYIQNRIGRLAQTFDLDAIFLDQIGAWSDDPGCDFATGSCLYAHEMADLLPGVVLGGEVIQERFRDLPLFQMWGTPWCGLRPKAIPGRQTEILALLFGEETRFFGHMGTPAGVDAPHSWPAYYWFLEHCGGAAPALEASAAYHRLIDAIPSVRVHPRRFGFDVHARAVLDLD